MSSDAPAVAVVGGGIAGLSAAWELSTPRGVGPRYQVTVLETADRLGGNLTSERFADRVVDVGADAFLTRRPEAVELCRELGLESELVAPATGTAYVWSRGMLRPLPAGLALGVPTRLGPLASSGILSPKGLARASFDALVPFLPFRRGRRPVPPHDAAVGALVGRRLGREVVERLAGPLIGGIHAGSVEDMSAAAVFPDLLRAASVRGSLMRNLRAAPPEAASAGATGGPAFLGVRGGMARLVERLGQRLTERGVTLRMAWPVTHLGRQGRWVLHGPRGESAEADAIVLAVPTFVAAPLLRPHRPHLADLLSSIEHASVTLVTMRFAAGDVGPLPPGSGLLMPRTAGGMVTACTWVTAKWPELVRADELLVRVSLGRHGDDRHRSLDDDAVVRQACEELRIPMAITRWPQEAMVARFEDAFPQYTVGHVALVAAMEHEAARVGGLALAGAALQGVGMPACIASGKRAGRAVTGHLEQTVWR
jgi:oxygen-dependent protoporphyrinogen oxidase